MWYYINMDLVNQKCVPCSAGASTLQGEELKKYFESTPGWEGYDGDTKIQKNFEFENFTKAIDFINQVARLAEDEGHHPNLYLHDFNKVKVELWTHKIQGLHQNDFIMAAKIDMLS